MSRIVPIALALAAAATSVGVPETARAAPPGPSLRWEACPAEVSAPELECARLDVPLDYRKPNGRTIEVAISRLPSKNPEKRRGVLLTNPGGPGGYGLGQPAQLKAAGLPQAVLDRYDVIGFDPRGAGLSTPVTCGMADQQLWGNIPPYARNAADVARHAKRAQTAAEQCADSDTAYMLPHTSTRNTARDMDRIRAALGEKKLSYLGYSYGSHLGAVYTTLYPGRSDRIVLDSNTVPTGLDATGARLMARGVEDRFPDFAAFAAARPEYGLGSTPEEVTAKFHELAGRLDKHPVRGVDGSYFRLLTLTFLYRDSRLPIVAEAWRALDTDQPLPPAVDPSLTDPDVENKVASHLYVICNDSRWSRSVGSYQRDVAVDRTRYPMFGAASANIRPCAFWKSRPAEPPVEVGDRGPSNVLMAQNSRDPATPLVGALQMRRALGDRARMVTADHGGHGVYVLGGNTCVDRIVTGFLAEGERPARDMTCAADPS
ncbi:alpha/beta hydrolase [Streptomyces rubiginosohelvolus]|uniref:alpha/beta hydrolase n=1 Tax=Streptomyces rubiginosohelvolus TaxID=67362 RepID=UPI003412A465